MLQAHFNDHDFQRYVRKLAKAEVRDFNEQLMIEGKLLLQDLVRITPPFGTSKKSQQVGILSLRRDIRKSMKEFWPERLRSRQHQQLVQKGRAPELREVVSGWKSKYKQWSFHPKEDARRLHETARKSTGGGLNKVRGRARKRYLLVPYKGWLDDNYMAQAEKRVGSLMAGWQKANDKAALAAKFPAWIKKAETPKAKGDGKIPDKTGAVRALEIANQTPTFTLWDLDVRSLLKYRLRSMQNRLRKILRAQGYGAMDLT